MQDMSPGEQRQAFAVWLRTGRRPTIGEDGVERKFNPYHDPRNGRFTFAPGGPQSLSRVVISRRRVPYVKPEERSVDVAAGTGRSASAPNAIANGNDRTGQAPGSGQVEAFKDGVARAADAAQDAAEAVGEAIEGLADDLTSVEAAVPSLKTAAAGALLIVPDIAFDQAQLAGDKAVRLAQQIATAVKEYVPAKVAAKLDLTLEVKNSTDRLRDIRLARAAAAAFYKDDLAPLQMETLQRVQDIADKAYERGKALLKSGALKVKISEELTLGNYVDSIVRRQIREEYKSAGISEAHHRIIRVNRREIETSDDELRYRRPDVRVGDVAFDVTLTKKTLRTPQIRGYFRSDFRPRLVIIVRPRQLANGGSYILTRPEL